MAEQLTLQSNLKQAASSDMTKYALFMGGTNVINDVLKSYDPLKTGYYRLFMVRRPAFLVDTIPNKINNFKHVLEYGNTAVAGLGDVTQDFNSISGGYVGKSFDIPSIAKDDTNSFQVTIYEFSGSPMREVIHSWINGANDLLTGYTTFNGADPKIARIQANQTAEFIYLVTDSTGNNVEYSCLLANCFPKGINTSAFNGRAGEHELMEMTVDFSCVKYESLQINEVAKKLNSKYRILTNSLNFYSGYDPNSAELGGNSGFGYNPVTGKLDPEFAGKTTEAPQRISTR